MTLENGDTVIERGEYKSNGCLRARRIRQD